MSINTIIISLFWTVPLSLSLSLSISIQNVDRFGHCRLRSVMSISQLLPLRHVELRCTKHYWNSIDKLYVKLAKKSHVGTAKLCRLQSAHIIENMKRISMCWKRRNNIWCFASRENNSTRAERKDWRAPSSVLILESSKQPSTFDIN